MKIQEEKLDETLSKIKIDKFIWSETIKDYVNNLDKSKKLLSKLTDIDYFDKQKEEIIGVQRLVSNYVEGVKNPEYQIAIVGAIKAGKSTFINSLLGYNLASVDVTPETATLTKFKSSEKNYISVSFYTKKEWAEIWKQANNIMKGNSSSNTFLKEYKNISADDVKLNCLDKENIKIEFDNINDLREEVKRWTSSKAKEHYFVKEIEIGLESLKLNKQICIVDTPGLNDVVEYRSNITLDYIDKANAVIICVNAKTLRNEELLTIAKVFSRAKHKRDKIYVLGTQLDTLNSTRDWEKQKEEWKKYLHSSEFYNTKQLVNNNLLGISAYVYNLFNIAENKDLFEEKDKDIEDVIEQVLLKCKSLKLIDKEEFIKLYSGGSVEFSEETKRKILDFSNIEKMKDVILKELINNYNVSLIEDFTERYQVIKEKLEDFKDMNLGNLNDLLRASTASKNEFDNILKEKNEEIEQMKKDVEGISVNVDSITSSFNITFSDLGNEFGKIKESISKINIGK